MIHYGLPDGPEQQQRDEMYEKTLHMSNGAANGEKLALPKPDINARYGTPEFSMWIYGYDTNEDLRNHFEEHGRT
jgi:hypothetical protein